MAKKIKPEQLSYEVGNILTEYSSEVAKAASRAAKEVGEKTADDLKQTSPKRTGKYAKSWSSTVVKDNGAVTEVSVHAGRYQLTHLLENGHLIKNGTGRTFGNVKPYPHIAKAEQKAEEEFVRKVKAAI